MAELIDMTGKTMGLWLILHRVPVKSPRAHWLCRCECGREKIIVGKRLRNGVARRCHSCARRGKKPYIKHGKYRTKLYKVWHSMKQRCNCKTDHAYSNYGGRGVQVCQEWQGDYVVFWKWALGNGYKNGLELDRRNNNGDYQPDNCRWVTRKEQCRNTRRNKMVTINGETKTAAEWVEQSGIKYTTFTGRIKNGVSGTDLLRPPKGRGVLTA